MLLFIFVFGNFVNVLKESELDFANVLKETRSPSTVLNKLNMVRLR